jgi:hypothetical protein
MSRFIVGAGGAPGNQCGTGQLDGVAGGGGPRRRRAGRGGGRSRDGSLAGGGEKQLGLL